MHCFKHARCFIPGAVCSANRDAFQLTPRVTFRSVDYTPTSTTTRAQMPRHQCIPLTDANTNTINSHLGLDHLAIFFLFTPPSPPIQKNEKKMEEGMYHLLKRHMTGSHFVSFKSFCIHHSYSVTSPSLVSRLFYSVPINHVRHQFDLHNMSPSKVFHEVSHPSSTLSIRDSRQHSFTSQS
jgi:hypothetical protein